MSTTYHVFHPEELLKFQALSNQDASDFQSSILVGQSIFGARFLFGPQFNNGLISLYKFLTENPSFIILDEYGREVDHKEMISLVISSMQFDNHPENEKHFILTSDGFLYSPYNFS